MLRKPRGKKELKDADTIVKNTVAGRLMRFKREHPDTPLDVSECKNNEQIMDLARVTHGKKTRESKTK
jgi:hypothetical protein